MQPVKQDNIKGGSAGTICRHSQQTENDGKSRPPYALLTRKGSKV